MQLVVFFVQETSLSIIYILQTRKYLRGRSPLRERAWSTPSTVHGSDRAQTSDQKAVLWQLVYANALIIALDITLLGIQCANLFHLQGAFKPCVYGIKLKVEFVILNRLINIIQQPASGGIYMRSDPQGGGPTGSMNQHGRDNGLWHHKSGVDPAEENDGVQLVIQPNAGNVFRSHSAESQTPIYHEGVK